MTVKLALLKSGEDLIADIQEMVVDNSVVDISLKILVLSRSLLRNIRLIRSKNPVNCS